MVRNSKPKILDFKPKIRNSKPKIQTFKFSNQRGFQISKPKRPSVRHCCEREGRNGRGGGIKHTPEAALAAGAAFSADGRSVNNALAFPGLFKAALDVGAPAITSRMKIAAAEAISALAPADELVPSPFHPDVHERVVEAVIRAASV